MQYEEFYLWKNMEAWKKDTYTVLGLWDVFSEELKYNLNPEKQLLVRLWIASRIITRGRGSRSRNLITTDPLWKISYGMCSNKKSRQSKEIKESLVNNNSKIIVAWKKHKKYRRKTPDNINMQGRKVIVEKWAEKLLKLLFRGKTEVLSFTQSNGKQI